MKKIVILGSTGSIGKTLIKLLKKDKKNIKILLLTTNKNIELLFKQATFFNVKNVIITDVNKFLEAKKKFKNKNISIYNHFNSLNKIFNHKKTDYTMNSISGLNGLGPTLNIIKYSKT